MTPRSRKDLLLIPLLFSSLLAIHFLSAHGLLANDDPRAALSASIERVLTVSPAYATGVKEPTKEEKAWASKHVRQLQPLEILAKHAADPLPSSAKNVQWLPRVGRQVFGACAAWAVVYYQKSYYEAREHGWVNPDPATHPERVSSPAFTYNLLNAGEDTGSSIDGNYEYLTKHGAATCATMSPNYVFYEWPTEAMWRDAHAQRIESHSTLDITTPEGVAAFKALLAGGDIAVFSMNLYNNFTSYPAPGVGISGDVYYATGNGLYTYGGNPSHALTIVGYDDNKSYTDAEGNPKTGAFLIVNSWGSEWGVQDPDANDGGFMWIAYDHFLSVVGSVYLMEDRLGYQPRDAAVVEISHGRMAELHFSALGGDKDNPLWQFDDCFPRSGGLRAMNVKVVIDLTDYSHIPTLSYWLRVGDVDVPQLWRPAMTGTVTHFSVEKEGRPVLQCADTPAETMETNVVLASLMLNAGPVQPLGAVFGQKEGGQGDVAWADIDNDGDHDVAFSAYDSVAKKYRIYVFRNDGDGNFTQTDAGLPGILGRMAFGDYDNDGYPDLVVSGWNDDYGEETRVFRNESGVLFLDCGFEFPAKKCHVAWVDMKNDGKLELALYAPENYSVDTTSLLIYKHGPAGFSLTDTVNVPTVGEMAWADYDNDGWLDVAFSGILKVGSYTEARVQLYRNQNGTLTEGPWWYGSPKAPVAWGDMDNDGWLDLATMTDTKVVLYRNVGGSSFDQILTSYGDLYAASLSWADMDNDGYSDLLVTGDLVVNSVLDIQKVSTVYWNRRDNSFIDMGLNLPGVSEGKLVAFDIDNDGDLDLCVYGLGEKPYPLPRITRLYRSDISQLWANTPPTAPIGLSSAAVGGGVQIRWNASSDEETSAAGLYYNVRAGRTPFSNDIISAVPVIPVFGNRVRPRLSPTQPGIILDPAPTGTFYFSVQAVDPSHAVSAWSVPLAVAGSGVVPGDVNNDGRLDAADLALAIRMSKGLESPNLARADWNSDGKIDDFDILFFRSALLGKSVPGAAVKGFAQIGPEGGSVSADGFHLSVPAGAFGKAEDIMLQSSTADRPHGAESISPSWYLIGVPDEIQQPLTITLRADATAGPHIRARVGETVYIRSIGQSRWTHTPLPVHHDGGEYYSFQIPVPDKPLRASQTSEFSPELRPAADEESEYYSTKRITLTGISNAYVGGHFCILYPSSVAESDVAKLASYLEEAYSKFKDVYGFSYAARSSWPMEVVVRELESTVYGYSASSRMGDNYAYMEFNSLKMSNAADMRVTAGHEFFHIVQSLYDPRNRVSKATFAARHLWLDEAASTWAEKLFSADPDYVSSVFTDSRFSLFDGMHKQGSGAGVHGYGLAPLIEYLVGRQGNTVLKSIYEDIKANRHPVHAVQKNSPDSLYMMWFNDFVTKYVRGQIMGFDEASVLGLSPKDRQWVISDTAALDFTRKFSSETYDLGATVFAAIPRVSIPADATLFAAVTGDLETVGASAIKMISGSRTFVGNARYTGNHTSKIEVPNITNYFSQNARVLLNLTNDNSRSPYDKKLKTGVTMAVSRNRKIDLTPVEITTGIGDPGYAFPIFTDTTSIQGRGMVNEKDHNASGLHWFETYVAVAEPVTINIKAGFTPMSVTTSRSAGANDYYLYTYEGITKYEVFQTSDQNLDGTTTVHASADFNIEINPERLWQTAVVYISYSIKTQYYSAQEDKLTDMGSSTVDTPTHIIIFNMW